MLWGVIFALEQLQQKCTLKIIIYIYADWIFLTECSVHIHCISVRNIDITCVLQWKCIVCTSLCVCLFLKYVCLCEQTLAAVVVYEQGGKG